MDSRVKEFYREILADLSIDREDSSDIHEFFTGMNPPPDKLVSIRAAAFSVGSEFLQEDDNETNIALLRCVNVLVHAVEKTCME